MKLYIPRIGDKLKLTDVWSFRVSNERRNSTLIALLESSGGLPADKTLDMWGTPIQNYSCHMEPGIVLQVDRIYIRKGQQDFDSITFRIASGVPKVTVAYGWKNKKKITKQVRFWVPIEEVNNKLEFKLEK